MIELFLSILLLIYFIFVSGRLFTLFVFKKNNFSFHIAEYGFLGIIFLTILTYIIHFFLPLNQTVNFIIFGIILILGTILNYDYIFAAIKKNIKTLLLSFLIVCLMSLKFKVNEDYGYYHLPYITNIISEKVIFGLANLQVNFAWNSSWLNFSSILNLPYLKLKGVFLSNSVLIFFVYLFFFNELFKVGNKTKLSFFYILFLTSYILIKFSRISEHGFDFPANFFLLTSIYYLLKIVEETNQDQIKKNVSILLIFSTYCISIKLTTFIAPLVFFYGLIYLIRKKINLSFLKPSLIVSFFLILIWTTQQFIYSGCFIAFFDFTCFKNLSWYVNDISYAVSDATGAVNKSFNQYTGQIPKEEYVKNFYWVSTWFERNKIELSEHILTILAPIVIFFIFIIFFKNKKILYLEKSKNDDNFLKLNIFFICILGLLIWFIKSPVIRFGIPYIFIFIFFVMYYLFLSKIPKEKLSYSGIYTIIILSIIFNLTKNFNRVKNIDTTEYWPLILNVNYSTNIVDNFKINFPDEKNDNYHKKKYCWSIPFICHMGEGNNLKFQYIHKYLVISKKIN